jgi:hypothetical protein
MKCPVCDCNHKKYPFKCRTNASAVYTYFIIMYPEGVPKNREVAFQKKKAIHEQMKKYLKENFGA